MSSAIPVQAVAFALLASAGCSYASDYVVPDDGRARLVNQDGAFVASLPRAGDSCPSAVASAVPGPTRSSPAALSVDHALGDAVMVAAILVSFGLPLALAHPERPATTAREIDLVNATNALARTPGTPCAPASPSADR
ncbi:MAG: hypothetical protein QM765_41460 [Myxococcales bacterium]